MTGRHEGVPGEGFDVERTCILAIDPVTNTAQLSQIAQVLRRGGSVAHRTMVASSDQVVELRFDAFRSGIRCFDVHSSAHNPCVLADLTAFDEAVLLEQLNRAAEQEAPLSVAPVGRLRYGLHQPPAAWARLLRTRSSFTVRWSMSLRPHSG